jgi:nitrogen fixation/metabolism regulation signal transduction histidine kinase
MKRFLFGLFAGKKIVFIFLLAIILPSIVIAYLSMQTFSQRRETVQQILESNLWISGNTALRSFENALLERERETLNNENLSVNSQDGRYFLLDDDYHILLPRTGIDGKPESFEEMDSSQLPG